MHHYLKNKRVYYSRERPENFGLFYLIICKFNTTQCIFRKGGTIYVMGGN